MALERVFFLTTIPGLETVAHLEFCERWAAARAFFPDAMADFPEVEIFAGGIEVKASLPVMATLIPFLKVTQRVLLRLGSFPAESEEELVQGLRTLNWSELFASGQTYRLNFTSRSSRLSMERQAEIVMAKVLRPLKLKPDKSGDGIFMRLFRDQCTLSIDLTGADGFKREDGRKGSIASLRSSTAAGLLRVLLQGVRGPSQVIDPMCGSGTFLLEALELDKPLRRELSLSRRPLFQGLQAPAGFAEALLQEGQSRHIQAVYGCDNQLKAVQLARRNLEELKVKATVDQANLFKANQGGAFDKSLAPIVVVNPPWGKRLPGTEEDFLAAILAKYQPTRIGLLMPAHWKVAVRGLEKVRDLPLLNSGVENRFLVFA